MTNYEIKSGNKSLGNIQLEDFLSEKEVKRKLNRRGVYFASSAKLFGKTGEILYLTSSNVLLIRQ